MLTTVPANRYLEATQPEAKNGCICVLLKLVGTILQSGRNVIITSRENKHYGCVFIRA